MAQMPTVTEADILKDVMGGEEGDLSPEVAQSMLRWKFTQHASARMTDLAGRNNEGTLSDEERAELEKYLRVGSFINLVQAKARLSLKRSQSPS